MYLKSLEISGFKSFAKKASLEFTAPITAIVGPNGSGKCVDGSSIVQLRSGSRVPIQELVETAISSASSIERFDDGVAAHSTDPCIEVASLNPETLSFEWKPVTSFVRRTAPETMLTIVTRAGRTITATPYHPLFTLREGRLTALRADELSVGSRVALPRALSIEPGVQELPFTEVLNSFDADDKIYLPSYEIAHELRERVIAIGGAAKYARTVGMASNVVQRVLDGQSLNIAYAAVLFCDAPESSIFADRRLISKTGGVLRVPPLVDERLARFLGYLTSEGRSTSSNQVWFVNEDRDIIADYLACTHACFDIEPQVFSYKAPPTKDVIIFSKTLGTFLSRLFGITVDGHSRDKRVPARIFASPRPVIAAFLSALFAGDAHIKATPRQSYVEYATASEQLARDVAALLLRLGISALIRSKEKYAANARNKTKRTYWSVFVYGNAHLRSLASVLAIPGKKGEALARLRKLPEIDNPNLDVIPDLCGEIRELVREAGVSVKRVRGECPTLAAYCEGRCDVTRGGIRRVLHTVARYGLDTQAVRERADRLEQIASSDVLWDEIVSIEERTGTGWVYDLTVAENHNFIANDIIVHNSNVAEAFRFVLGEQSIKSMRGKRTEDLIWNGSQSVSRANRANVTLTFDNTPRGRGGRLFDLDFDTVSLERVIHRDSSSEYLLNASPVRLKDIIEHLAKAHIGSTGHHIISQGEADRILSVNPRERKSMLEDALGLKIYHYKKEESVRKLEKTGENIEKIEGLRREIKPHLTFLGKQVEKLEKAKELAEDLKVAYREYFAREKAYLDATRAKISTEEGPLKKQLDDFTKKLTKAQATLSQLDGKDLKSDDVLSLEATLENIRNENDELSRQLGRLEGELGALIRQQEREEKRLKDEDARTIPAGSVRKHLSAIEAFLHDLADDAPLPAFRNALSGIKEAVRTFHAFLREGATESGTLEEIVVSTRALQEQKREYEEKRHALETKETEAREKYRALQKEIEADRTTSREAERAVFAISNEVGAVRVELERLKGMKDALALEEDEYKRDVGEAAALIGRDAAGETSAPADAHKEPRTAQHERKRALERMKIRLEDSGIAGADDLMKEHRDVQERDLFLERELNDLRASAESLQKLITDLEETLAREFAEGLEKINAQFTAFFAVMFGGGTALLKLVKEMPRRRRSVLDELDDVSEATEATEANEAIEGIEIAVDLPRKKVRSLEMLSGGERALTSIALIFAMSQVNPPPFIILDETDAALDEANSRRYGDMIESLAKHTQLILITHNRETMSRAGVLYGVTMGRDAVSQLLSVSFGEAVAVAK